MRRHSQFGASLLALVLVISCKREDVASTPAVDASAPAATNKQDSAPAPAAVPSKPVLPEFYGLYACDDRKLVELKTGGDLSEDSFSATVEFVWFDKRITAGLPKLELRRRMLDPQGTWGPLSQGNPIELRTKPIENQTEMVRIVPVKHLQPGVYGFQGGAPFFVERNEFEDTLLNSITKKIEAPVVDEATIREARTALNVCPSRIPKDAHAKVTECLGIELANAVPPDNGDGHPVDAVWAMAFSGDARSLMVLCAAKSGILRAQNWSVDERRCVATVDLARPYAEYGRLLTRQAGFSPDLRVFVICNGNDMQAWDTSTGALKWEWRDMSGDCWSFAIAPDSKRLVKSEAPDHARGLEVVDTESREILRRIPGPSGKRGFVTPAFSANGTMIAAASRNQAGRCELVLFDAETGTQTRLIEVTFNESNQVLFPGDKMLIVLSGDETNIVDTSGGRSVPLGLPASRIDVTRELNIWAALHKGIVTLVDFGGTAQGQRPRMAREIGRDRLLEARAKAARLGLQGLLDGASGDVSAFALAPDGKFIACWHDGSGLMLYRIGGS